MELGDGRQQSSRRTVRVRWCRVWSTKTGVISGGKRHVFLSVVRI